MSLSWVMTESENVSNCEQNAWLILSKEIQREHHIMLMTKAHPLLLHSALIYFNRSVNLL